MITEGEVLSVKDIDSDVLIPCTVMSRYEFKGRSWLILKAIRGGKEYRRPEAVFIKPDRKIEIHSK